MLTHQDREASNDPALQRQWWPERPCEEPQPYENQHLRVVQESLTVDSGLPRRQQMTLAAALYRPIHQYHYGRLEFPETVEILATRAVAALRRAQDTLGRDFEPGDIQLHSNAEDVRDFEDWSVTVLLCGAPIGHAFTGDSAAGLCPDSWVLMPECPLFVFADDLPRVGDPANAQDLIFLDVCPTPPAANQREALADLVSDAGLERLRLAAVDALLPRVRRRLAIGGRRELTVGWRAAVPAEVEPPIRWPRRLRTRKTDDRRAEFDYSGRWWNRGRRDAGLPVGEVTEADVQALRSRLTSAA